MEVESVIGLLCEPFPKAFARFEQRRQPLKIGIHHDLLASLAGQVPENAAQDRSATLDTANPVYRSRLLAGATRIDLEGNSAGTVTAEQVPPVKPKPQSRRNIPAPRTIRQPTQIAPRAPSTVATVKRASLADLREAALRRKT